MGTPIKDVEITEKLPKILLTEKHISYIEEYGKKKDDYEYVLTEYLRMSGVYWGLTAMDLMHSLHKMDREEVLDFVKSCRHDNGGYSPAVNHDPHILYTLSAIQILCLFDALGEIDTDSVVTYIKGLQQADGSFYGDQWGEVDTRFTMCAVACLALLGRLDTIDQDKASDFLLSCMNFDGGFGSRPGSETHSGQVYCCLGALSILGRLDLVKQDTLGWWLCERQLPSGGLNGRPEKLPDTCYSWWVLSSLKIIGRLDWIDKEALRRYILACQDDEDGGFADRPGDMADPFHTLFGLAGLSLMGDDTLKTRPAFASNVRTAYDILGQTKITSKAVRGINGNAYMEIMLVLTKPLPKSVNEKLLRQLKVRDHELVTYNLFHSAVFTILVLIDYTRQSEALYKMIEGSQGPADRATCECLLKQLSKACESQARVDDPALALWDSGVALGPERVQGALLQALAAPNARNKTMSQEEFVSSAADCFLTHVKSPG